MRSFVKALRSTRIALLGVFASVILVPAAHTTTCTLAGCGDTVDAQINTGLHCNAGAACPGVPCTGSPLRATGQIRIAGGGCSMPRLLQYCQKIVNSQGTAICTSCTSGTFGTGTTVLTEFTCAISQTDTYIYGLTVNDITCDIQNLCSCGGCIDTGNCNCDCNNESTIASCGIVAGP